MAIPAEMAQYLNLKYANLAKQAEANIIQANAGMLQAQGGAAKNFAEAGVIPANSAAEINYRNAAAANQLADAGRATALTGQIPLDGASTRAYQASGTDKNIADTLQQRTVTKLLQRPGGSLMEDVPGAAAGMPPVSVLQSVRPAAAPALASGMLSTGVTTLPAGMAPADGGLAPGVFTPSLTPARTAARVPIGTGLVPVEEEPVRRRAGGPGIYTWGAT